MTPPLLLAAEAAADAATASAHHFGISLNGLDWTIVAVYAAVILTVGLLVGRKPASSESYFLAGRSLRWPFIGASLFAANISAEHFVGLAGGGFAFGLALGSWEWSAVFGLAPLIVLFLPFYIKNKIYTVPEFLERRFGPSVRMTFSLFMIVLSVLAKISISLYASSLVLGPVLGMDKVAVIWVIGFLTALYTMKGGLKAVVYTDALQSIILILAGCILVYKGMEAVGWWDGLKVKLEVASKANGGYDYLNMIQPATNRDVPWFGMTFATILVGSFYWSMDQVLVQRVFAAKDLNEGRLGATFCGFLKLTTPFLLVLPGIIALALYHNGALTLPNKPGTLLVDNDSAYPALLAKLMPHGLLGLTVAGIAAALMGHLAATYNSIGTLVTRDLYLKFKPEAGHKEQIMVGRVAVLVVFILGALWAPLLAKSNAMFQYLQAVQCYMMIPFAFVFFLGVFWKRTTPAAVLSCVATSVVLATLFIYNSNQMDEAQAAGKAVHSIVPFMDNPYLRPFTHSALVSGVLSLVVLVVVSFFTKPVASEKLATTTISGDVLTETGPKPAPYRDYRVWFTLAVVCSAGLWIFFSL